MRITQVPLHKSDLVRRGCANGFEITEAFSLRGAIPKHAHAKLSLTILLEGTFEETYASSFKPHECTPASLLVRPAGEVHANRLGTQGGRTLSVEIDPKRLEVYGVPLTYAFGLRHQREGAYLDLAWAISQELCSTDSAAALSLEGLVLELLARLVRVARVQSEKRLPSWVIAARDMIHDRFRDPALRVADLATANGVHPVYFARAFREHFHVSPGQYIRHLRVAAARARLRTTAQPLASLALDCGFADQSHLSRAMRRKFGMAPKEFRKVFQLQDAPTKAVQIDSAANPSREFDGMPLVLDQNANLGGQPAAGGPYDKDWHCSLKGSQKAPDVKSYST